MRRKGGQKERIENILKTANEIAYKIYHGKSENKWIYNAYKILTQNIILAMRSLLASIQQIVWLCLFGFPFYTFVLCAVSCALAGAVVFECEYM